MAVPMTMLCRSILLTALMVPLLSGQNYQETIVKEVVKLRNVDWRLLEEKYGDLDKLDKFPNRKALNQYQLNSASTKSVSQKCLDSLDEYASHLEKPLINPYASEMDYSSGHFPSNPWQELRYSYTLTFLGYYTQCYSVLVPSGLSFDGPQYCLIRANLGEGFSVVAYLGECLPNGCSDEEYYTLLESYIPENLTMSGVSLTCTHIPPLTSGAIICLVVCGLLLFLMLIATIYDYLLRYEKHKRSQFKIPLNGHVENYNTPANVIINPPNGVVNPALETPIGQIENQERKNGMEEEAEIELKEKSPRVQKFTSTTNLVKSEPIEKAPYHPGRLGRALLSFSVLSNMTKLLSTNQSGNLGALNGLRVLSMFWVILGHILSFINPRKYENLKYLFEVMSYTGFQLILNATFAVDTFFVLSGFLVAYLTLRELHKNKGKLNWFLFYFHRYWRLTPTLAFIILFFLLSVYFVEGPTTMYNHLPLYTQQCRENWWATLLYIGNLYHFPGTLSYCIGWAWYLAVDFQCYIVSPLFIILLYKNWKIGLSVTIVAMLSSMGATAGVATYFGVSAGFDSMYYNDNSAPNAEYIYDKPWTRLPVYLVGILTGWFVLKCEREKLSLHPFLKKKGFPKVTTCVLVFLGWCVSTGLALGVLFGLYPTVVNAYDSETVGNYLEQWEAVLYLSASRVAWAISITWVAFACIHGYGGPINQFLSWKFWIPLGRLTYCAYLIHPITLSITFWTWNVPYYFEWYSLICLFISQVVVAYVSAIFLSLAVESPMIGLEKVLLGKK